MREIHVGRAERSIRKGKVPRNLNLLLWKDTERLAARRICLLSHPMLTKVEMVGIAHAWE